MANQGPTSEGFKMPDMPKLLAFYFRESKPPGRDVNAVSTSDEGSIQVDLPEKMPESFGEASSMVVKMLSPIEDLTPFKVGQLQKIIETLHQPTGQLLAPFFAVLQVLFLLAWLGYFVWGIVALCLDREAIWCDCANHWWIWLYGLLVIVIPTSLGAILGCIRGGLIMAKLDDKLPAVALSIPGPAIVFFFALQGFIMWHDMTPDCTEFYSENHMQLLVLFHIQVILMCIAFVVSVFTLVAQVSVSGYQSVDDADKHEHRVV